MPALSSVTVTESRCLTAIVIVGAAVLNATLPHTTRNKPHHKMVTVDDGRPFTVAAPFYSLRVRSDKPQRLGFGDPNGISHRPGAVPTTRLTPSPSESRDSERLAPDSSRCLARALASQVMATHVGFSAAAAQPASESSESLAGSLPVRGHCSVTPGPAVRLVRRY